MSEVEDYSEEIKRALEDKLQAALEAIGLQAESYAKSNITAAGRVDTGNLRNSVTHTVKGDTVYTGSSNSYALFHEVGTGIYSTMGNKGTGWWIYVPGNTTYKSKNPKRYTYEEAKRIVAAMRAKGIDAHMSQGIKPIHFLKNAMAEHISEYLQIAEKKFKE